MRAAGEEWAYGLVMVKRPTLPNLRQLRFSGLRFRRAVMSHRVDKGAEERAEAAGAGDP
jgi:hypothetical protein